MNESMQEAGERLIRKAEGILRRDVQGALAEQDFNMAVRRAQEVVELVLKGALQVLGIDYPKVHDVAPVFSEQVRQKRGPVDAKVLERIEAISFWLGQARAPSFYPTWNMTIVSKMHGKPFAMLRLCSLRYKSW